jgi:hypothetical protein
MDMALESRIVDNMFTLVFTQRRLFSRDTKAVKRRLDDDDDDKFKCQGMCQKSELSFSVYFDADMYATPEVTKRSKSSPAEDDYTPPSRIVPTVDLPDSTTPFADFYENPFQSACQDPSMYSSPYSRFAPTYPFAYSPMTPAGSSPSTNPFTYAAAAAAAAAARYSSPYSFSSPYYQYPTAS